MNAATRARYKKAADDFQQQQAPGTSGDTPETGLDDSLDNLIPERNADNPNRPLEGRLPSPAEEGEAGSFVGSIMRRLLDAGVSEDKLAAAAHDVRTTGYTRFFGPEGKVVADVGVGSPLGQELKTYGQAQAAQATDNAAGFRYKSALKNVKTGGP